MMHLIANCSSTSFISYCIDISTNIRPKGKTMWHDDINIDTNESQKIARIEPLRMQRSRNNWTPSLLQVVVKHFLIAAHRTKAKTMAGYGPYECLFIWLFDWMRLSLPFVETVSMWLWLWLSIFNDDEKRFNLRIRWWFDTNIVVVVVLESFPHRNSGGMHWYHLL